MSWIVPRPSILDPKPIFHGFVVEDGLYAIVPMGTKFCVIFNGRQDKVCRTEKSARNHITNLRKKRE